MGQTNQETGEMNKRGKKKTENKINVKIDRMKQGKKS